MQATYGESDVRGRGWLPALKFTEPRWAPMQKDVQPLYDQAALDAARMAGVRSVQEQTAVIVRAALELLESIEGETPFTAEALRAFRRVFGA